ncbi:MAG: GNAT family N-acetyltransferase [Lapillicoccus sp.]
MSRPQVNVRLVDEEHEGDLVDLWMENRVESGGGSEPALRASSLNALTTALQRPDVTAFLAVVDDSALGYLVLKDSLAGPLTDSPCTSIDQLFVSAPWRRHGVARQLLAAAAAHADRVGAEAIVSHVPSQVRDANRFFARLGFSPTVVRRVTTPAALHRKLAASGESAALRRVDLEEVIQRRRTARFRAVRQSAAARATDV